MQTAAFSCRFAGRALREAHPGVYFSCFKVEDDEDALGAVRSGTAEVGVVPWEHPDSELREHRVGAVEFMVAFPPGTGPPGGFPCSYKSLEGVPLIAPREDTAPGRLLPRVRGRGVRVPIAMEHPPSFVRLVAAGVGAAFPSGPLAREAELAGAVVGSLSPKAEYPVFLVHREGGRLLAHAHRGHRFAFLRAGYCGRSFRRAGAAGKGKTLGYEPARAVWGGPGTAAASPGHG